MRFSDRIGETQISSIIQRNSINESLKNTLWNVYDEFILSKIKRQSSTRNLYSEDIEYLTRLWHSFFKETVDSISPYTETIVEKIREWYFYRAEWYQIYNFIEFHVSISEDDEQEEITNAFNKLLIQELSAYRFINNILVSIVSELEINAIENAISNSEMGGLLAVKRHLVNSIDKLSNKTNPDYKNSIQEAISAVESLCKIIADDDKATLEGALRKLKNKIEIHPALELSIQKLYGFASDTVRHGKTTPPNISQEDAIFTLVTCSAFINYMIVKNEKIEKLIEAGK